MLGHTKGWIAPITLAGLLERSLVTYSLGTTAGDFAAPLAAGFAVALAAGAWRGLRSAPSSVMAVLIYLLAPLLAAFAISLARPMFDERYFMFVIPAYAIALAWIAAASGGTAAGRVPRRDSVATLGLVAIALVCIASLNSLGNYYTQPQYAKSPGWRELVQFIVRSASPGDIVIQNYPDPSLSYYLDGRLPLTVVPGSGPPLQQAATGRQLADLLRSARRVWLLPYQSADWDATGYVQQWLRERAVVAATESPGGIEMELYLVRAP
jgi:hypothetical protein